MEAHPAEIETETIYGKSLGLKIPRLTCSHVDCKIRNAFITERPEDDVINANKYIVNMINCFVDFFIQYQTIDDEPVEFVMQTLLELKKTIFSFCLVGNYFDKFFARFQERFPSFIIRIQNRFEITKNVGMDETFEFEGASKSFLWFKRKATNLFLLGLSYKILSMSSSLGINIKDMIGDIIPNEIKREKEGEGNQSFILQFLPRNKELKCFKEVEDFFLEQMNSVVFQKITAVAAEVAVAEETGGSKRLQKYHTRSRKHKSRKHKSRKHKSRKHKSRKSNKKNAKKK